MRLLVSLTVAAVAVATLSPRVEALIPPGAIEVTCDVDRKEFRSLARVETEVIFRLWDAETGGTQCGPDHVVPLEDANLLEFKVKTDRVRHLGGGSQKPRKFMRIEAVLGSDAMPLELCTDESWMEAALGSNTLSCAFSEDEDQKNPPAPPARKRLRGVPFAQECETCTTAQTTQDISVRVFNSANISIPDGGAPALTFNSERWDTASIHDPNDPTKLTAPAAGKYLIFGHVVFATNNGVGVRQLAINLNDTDNFLASIVVDGVDGADALPGPAGPGGHHMSISTHYELAAGDYVTLDVYQNSGAALNVITSSNLSPEFGMVKLP